MHLIHEYGLIAVAAIVGLECLGLPVPGEAALLSAAVYAGTKHDLNIVDVILTAAAAAIVGRMIGYVGIRLQTAIAVWQLCGVDDRQDQTWAISVRAVIVTAGEVGPGLVVILSGEIDVVRRESSRKGCVGLVGGNDL